MKTSLRMIQAALLGGLIATVVAVLAQAPTQGGATPPTDAQVRDLEQQMKSLQQTGITERVGGGNRIA